MIFFSLIICTLGQRKEEFKRLLMSLQNQTFNEFEIIVVSQKNHEIIDEILNSQKFVFKNKHIKINKIGLSHARNVGLKEASGKYMTISDDDCWYPNQGLEIIRNSIIREKHYNVFCFKIYDTILKVPYKKYDQHSQKISIWTIGSRSSIEIFFLREKLKNIVFDENFGLGAKFSGGEENIFLSDLLKAGNRIIFIPEFVVYHKKPQQSKQVFNLSKMEQSYKMLQRVFGKVGGFFIYYIFFIKHFRKITDKKKSLFPFLKQDNT